MTDFVENSDNPKRYKLPDEFRSLSHSILNCANRGEPKSDFLCEVSRLILDFSGCDTIRIISLDAGTYFCCSARKRNKSLEYDISVYPFDDKINKDSAESMLDTLTHDVINRNFDSALPFFTSNGSFWTGNADQPLVFGQVTQDYPHFHGLVIGGDYLSVAIIPIMVAGEVIGALKFLSRQREHFKEFDIGLYETVALTLGVALVNQRAQAALRERVKELTCLYGIATLAEKPDTSPATILQGIVDLLPLAWQYPEITCAKIVFNGDTYLSSGFREGVDSQKEEIVVDGKSRGYVEVIYTESKPAIDEGPFLKEERNLIDAVATQINLIIEQKQAEEERQRLQEQLRHADRLATIGQLSAGVAHELNEPLGNILGFAQLAKKEAGLPEQASGDLEKIINAALHAREVVKKLMLFARQTPPRRNLVDLNKIISEGLYFLESRCQKAGVAIVRCLEPGLPSIMADQSQLNQVLVNLVVNAVQAMPDGGTLTIKTSAADGNIILSVEDTGIGMSKEVIKKLFIPFFTTKDVNEGTGLGLSVVHGIVTLHGGAIKVTSEEGKGSAFEIQLPLKGGEEADDDD
jgi:two-component system NtrC family sensor kinase